LFSRECFYVSVWRCVVCAIAYCVSAWRRSCQRGVSCLRPAGCRAVSSRRACHRAVCHHALCEIVARRVSCSLRRWVYSASRACVSASWRRVSSPSTRVRCWRPLTHTAPCRSAPRASDTSSPTSRPCRERTASCR
jgi:hypothetical protein